MRGSTKQILAIIIIISFFSTPLSLVDLGSTGAVYVGSIQSNRSDELFGYSIASAGDVNGDGIGDIIVGAPGHDNDTGRAYIFYGGTWFDGNLQADAANVTLTGIVAGDRFGSAVSGAGDVNNDGYDDVIIGAPYSSGLFGSANSLYRKKMVFNNSGVSENLTDFPAMIKLTTSNFNYSHAKQDGTDLRFYDQDDYTPLKYHIEEWDPAGESYIWVNVTGIDGGSTTDFIWMYYGNPYAEDVQDAQGTYDDDYLGVWHLNEASGTVVDSTGNGNNGTQNGGVTTEAAGKVNGAYDFDGVNDFIDFGTNADLRVTGNITLETWIKIDTVPDSVDASLISHGTSGEAESDNWLYLMLLTDDGSVMDLDLGHESGSGTDVKTSYDTNLAVDTWYHVAATRDVSEKEWRLYINGNEFGTPFSYSSDATGGTDGILMTCRDWWNPAWRYTDGILDEVRISTVPRSADWISAQYLSMSDSFITYGNEEVYGKDCGTVYVIYGNGSLPAALDSWKADVKIIGTSPGGNLGSSMASAGDMNNDGYDDIIAGAPGCCSSGDPGKWWNESWQYRQELVFDNSMQSESLTNFIVLVTLNSTNFDYSKAETDGKDLRFIDDDGSTELDYHIEEWDVTGNSDIWVNVTRIDNSSNEDFIWMYFGNDDAPDVQSSAGTYDDSYAGVWHLSETGSGSSGEYKGATRNMINGTGGAGNPSKTPGRVNGKIGHAQDFDGLTDLIHFGTDRIPDMTYHTITSWVYLPLAGSTNNTIVCYKNLINPFKGISLYVRKTDGAIGTWHGLPYYYSSGNKITAGEWAYLAIRGYKHSSSGYLEISVNGGDWENIYSGDTSNLDIVSSTPLTLGAWSGAGPTAYTKGVIDEVRISNVPRSKDWNYAQYLSMDNSFITYGNQEEFKMEQGAAHVIFGNGDFDPIFYSKDSNLTITGENNFDQLGSSVAGCGDLNKDGYDDVAIGATGADRVYIIYGDSALCRTINASTADVTITGTAGDGFGTSISAGGDVNGDTYNEIIIGAPGNASYQGAVYIFYGTSWNTGTALSSATGADVVITGEAPFDNFGHSVASTGNYNVDGFDDIIIGAPNATGCGSVYVFYGNGTIQSQLLAADSDHKMIGENVSDNLGWSVCGANTIRYDIYDYVFAGAPYAGGAADTGKVYFMRLINNIYISWVRTYDLQDFETSTFSAGENVLIRTRAGHYIHSGRIDHVNITITAPDHTILIDDQAMQLEQTDPGAPSQWRLYNFSFLNPAVPGTYEVKIDAVSNSGERVNFTKYYDVEAGPPDKILISSDPASILADGKNTSVITIKMYDEFGNPISGKAGEIILKLDLGGGSFGPINDLGNGTYNFTYTAPTVPQPDAVINISSGSIFNTTTMDLIPMPLDRLDITPAVANLVVNTTRTFVLRGYDMFNNPVDISGAVWTTDTGSFITTTDKNATFRAQMQPASGFVNVTVGTITGNAIINVLPGPLDRIMVTPDKVNLVVGMEQSFTAKGYDEYGNEIAITPIWSTDAGTMNNSILTARTTPGIGFVYANADDVVGTAEIIITPGPLDHLLVTPSYINVSAGATQVFSAAGYDRFGNQIGIAPVWTSTAGSMSGSALTAPTKVCKLYVNATSETISGTAVVNVVPAPLDSIIVIPAQIEVEAGTTQQFSAMGYDEYYNVVDIDPTWSTDIGNIQDGKFTAPTTTGPGRVTARVGYVSGTSAVTIIPGPLKRIVVNPDNVEMIAGTNREFGVAGYDQFNNTISIVPIWYCTTTVGTMDGNVLKANIKVGKGTVTATYMGVTGMANVTIIHDELNEIFVAPPHVEVLISETQEFVAIGYDRYQNTVPIDPQWSSDVGTMNGCIFTAQDKPGIGYVIATETLDLRNRKITGVAEVEVVYDTGPNTGRPQIVGVIPDQHQYEDCPPWELDLTPFESDNFDSGAELKWYVTGVNTSLFTVTGEYSEDDRLTFTPVGNAYGSCEIDLWLIDSDNLKTAESIWVNLTPVNDKPSIIGSPDLSVHYDDPYTFCYEPYIYDVETPTSELVISTLETSGYNFTTVSGLNVTYYYPQKMLNFQVFVTIVVSDGEDTGKEVISIHITDNWVPKLTRHLPDIHLFEGTALYGAFDLDDYFFDHDGDSLYYTYGETYVNVTINDDHRVDISSFSEWSGTDSVTFRAEDPSGALAEDTILITVIPVNDPPVIFGVPDLVVHYDHDYMFNLAPYINDDDNDIVELDISTSDLDHIRFDETDNTVMIINYPESMNGITVPVTISVSDGTETDRELINIRVTDDYPPEVKTSLPDVELFEDTVLNRYFDLDQYFFDLDGDSLFYTYGNTRVKVAINDDNTVNIGVHPNWYGVEYVTFRAIDPHGALAEDTIAITVIPVNDPPVIGEIADQKGQVGNMWLLDLTDYISDIDNSMSELIITVDSEYVVVSGYKLVFFSEQPLKRTVTINVSDGADHATRSFQVSFGEGESVMAVSSVINSFIVLLIIAIALGMLFVYRKYNGNYIVEEAYLIYENGTLMAHRSNKNIPEGIRDDEIISGMFTAVQDFISDSFACKQPGIGDRMKDPQGKCGTVNEWQLQELNLEGHKIMIEHSRKAYLAVIYTGRAGWKLNQLTKLIINEIDNQFSPVLENWRGNMEKIKGIDYLILPLVDERVEL